MKELAKGAVVLTVALLVAGSCWGAFQASDLVYVPVAAHNEGVEGTSWRTDLYITNVDTEPADVAIFFLQSGLVDNSGYLTTREYAAGGRDDQGFGIVDESLADIPPNGTVTLTDVVGQYWLDKLGSGRVPLGALVVFACDAGGFQDDGGCSTYRNVVVQSRTYNQTTIWVPDPDNEGQYIQEDATYGQVVPGVPWYNLADGGAVIASGDFTYQMLSGGVQDGTYRYNVGVLNASDLQTTIHLRISPYNPDGTPVTDENDNPISYVSTIPPLGHIQYNAILNTIFGLDGVSGILLKVGFDSTQGWTTSSPNPTPMFTCYGSVVDGRTGDATTVLPSFAFPYDVDCMWSGSGSGSGGGTALAGPLTVALQGNAEGRHRPFEMPPRR